MLFNELSALVRAGVEDINGLTYKDPELLGVVNQCMQEVIAQCQASRKDKLLTKETIVFAVGDTEKDLAVAFHHLSMIEDENGNRTEIASIQHKDMPNFQGELYYYQTQAGGWKLGRQNTTKAETFVVWFSAIYGNAGSVSSTMDLSFLSPAAINLIIKKSELALLGNRMRRNPRKEFEENQRTNTLLDEQLTLREDLDHVQDVESCWLDRRRGA